MWKLDLAGDWNEYLAPCGQVSKCFVPTDLIFARLENSPLLSNVRASVTRALATNRFATVICHRTWPSLVTTRFRLATCYLVYSIYICKTAHEQGAPLQFSPCSRAVRIYLQHPPQSLNSRAFKALGELPLCFLAAVILPCVQSIRARSHLYLSWFRHKHRRMF